MNSFALFRFVTIRSICLTFLPFRFAAFFHEYTHELFIFDWHYSISTPWKLFVDRPKIYSLIYLLLVSFIAIRACDLFVLPPLFLLFVWVNCIYLGILIYFSLAFGFDLWIPLITTQFESNIKSFNIYLIKSHNARWKRRAEKKTKNNLRIWLLDFEITTIARPKSNVINLNVTRSKQINHKMLQ